MDSLFNTNFESTPSPHSLPTVKLKAHTYELQESNVRLKVSNEIFYISTEYKWQFYTNFKFALKTPMLLPCLNPNECELSCLYYI